jgi:hypothetical protein
MIPFSFLLSISVFLEKSPRQDALGTTIPISLDLWHLCLQRPLVASNC